MKTQLAGAYQTIVSFVTKNKQNKLISLAAALLLILLLSTAIALLTRPDTPTQAPTASQAPIAQVTITKDGFIPATISVKKGTKVIWTNSDEAPHQVQANPHPTGDSLPGLKSEILNNQQTYEYVADTAGSFGYHDHLNPTVNGSLDVTE